MKSGKTGPLPPKGVCGPLLLIEQDGRQDARDRPHNRVRRPAARAHQLSADDLVTRRCLGAQAKGILTRRTDQQSQQVSSQEVSPSSKFTNSETEYVDLRCDS